jgi:hypothetical protein
MAKLWTEQQFAELYANPGMPAKHLGERIDRTKGAVEVVRGFVCGWHRGGDTSGLNPMMIEYLERHRGRSVCAD